MRPGVQCESGDCSVQLSESVPMEPSSVRKVPLRRVGGEVQKKQNGPRMSGNAGVQP